MRRIRFSRRFHNDLGLQHLADDDANQSVGFLHAAPGFVASNWGHETKVAGLIKLAQRMFAKSADDCAKVMVDAMRDPRYASGFHCVNERGEPASVTSAHGAENVAALQEHWRSVRADVLGAEDARP